MEIRFKLNPKNEKDLVIIKALQGEYSPAETIKNILYKMGTNGVEGQRVSFGGLIDEVVVGDGTPIDNNEGNKMDGAVSDDRCQVVENEDMAYFFCN